MWSHNHPGWGGGKHVRKLAGRGRLAHTKPVAVAISRSVTPGLERKVQQALNDVWRRMLEPIQKLAERMTEPEPKFHDSIVENIREMVRLVPDLNITDDPALANAARTIEDTLNTVNPERLRASQFARVEAAEKAIGLLAQFGQLGQRKLAA